MLNKARQRLFLLTNFANFTPEITKSIRYDTWHYPGYQSQEHLIKNRGLQRLKALFPEDHQIHRRADCGLRVDSRAARDAEKCHTAGVEGQRHQHQQAENRDGPRGIDKAPEIRCLRGE